ncbi:MAG: RNA polymerase sigma factor [Parvularculaceae bacterium]
MDRHLTRILRLAHRMLGDAAEAEDVAQDVFFRVWRHAAKWKPGQAKFETWMHRVAINLCLDRLRRRRETVTDSPPDVADPGARPDGALLEAQTSRAIEEALARLPARQRAAIVLCHYQELSNIEAAEAMSISVEAVESLLSRGRRKLRDELASIRPYLKFAAGKSDGPDDVIDQIADGTGAPV